MDMLQMFARVHDRLIEARSYAHSWERRKFEGRATKRKKIMALRRIQQIRNWLDVIEREIIESDSHHE